jgi:hypothetical protein
MKRLIWSCVAAALLAGGAHGLQYLQRQRTDRLSRVREMERFGWLPKWGLSEQAFLASEHARCFAPAFRIEAFSSRFDRPGYERCLDRAAEQQLGRLARLEQPYWSRQDAAWLRLDYTLKLSPGAALPERGLLQRQRYECAGEVVGGGESPVPGELIGHALVGAREVGQRTSCFLILALEIEGTAPAADASAMEPGVALASLRLPFPPAAQEIHEPTPAETPAPEPVPTPTPAPKAKKRR